MLALIGDVLSLPKIKNSDVSLEMESQNPGLLIDGYLEMIAASDDQNLIEVRGKFDCDNLPIVRIDSLRFKQALLNLRSNGVKYNQPGGGVVLECNSSRKGILHISVSDNGPGIPDDMREKVFEPFDRLGAENSSIPGNRNRIDCLQAANRSHERHGELSKYDRRRHDLLD